MKVLEDTDRQGVIRIRINFILYVHLHILGMLLDDMVLLVIDDILRMLLDDMVLLVTTFRDRIQTKEFKQR